MYIYMYIDACNFLYIPSGIVVSKIDGCLMCFEEIQVLGVHCVSGFPAESTKSEGTILRHTHTHRDPCSDLGL